MKNLYTTGSILELKFNEGVGTVSYDSSGNDNHGTIGGATWVTKGLSFNGTNNYIACGDGASLDVASAVSIEAWITTSSFGTNQYRCIVGRRTGSIVDGCGLQYGLSSNWADGDRLIFWTHKVNVSDCNGKCYITSSPISLNTWYHVVGTYDSATGDQKIYLNGILDGTSNEGVGILIRSFTNQQLEVGRNPMGYWHFDGTIGEVRIHNRALTSTETSSRFTYTRSKYGV